MNCDDAVKQHCDHEKEQPKCKVVQERIAYHLHKLPQSGSRAMRALTGANWSKHTSQKDERSMPLLIDDVIAAINIKSFACDEARCVVR